MRRVACWISQLARDVCAVGLVKAGNLALAEGVLEELFREVDEDGFAFLDGAVADLANGEHEGQRERGNGSARR